MREHISKYRMRLLGIGGVLVTAIVALRLKIDDASQAANADSATLTWGVCSQPWEAGGKLMLRISESEQDLTGATNDTACSASSSFRRRPESRGVWE